jgi:hypothetical protein
VKNTSIKLTVAIAGVYLIKLYIHYATGKKAIPVTGLGGL